MGFHKSVPLLPSLTPRAKASSSWRFLSCLLALWVISSPPRPPLLSSASTPARLDSHRRSIFSEESRGGGGKRTDAACNSQTQEQQIHTSPPRIDSGTRLMTSRVKLTLHLVYIWWQWGARGVRRPGVVVGGLRAGVCLTQWPSFTRPERERETETQREGERKQGPRGWELWKPGRSRAVRTVSHSSAAL